MATTRRSTRSKAPGLKRDYSDTDYRESDIYDGPEPTKGIYRMELVSVGDHTSADDNESVMWVLRAMEGEENKHGDSVAGWKGRKYTNGDGAKWVEQKLAYALGLIKNPKDSIDMSYADMVKKAKPCRALVAVERYIPEDGGDPEWRATLTSVFMPDDGGASKTKAKSRTAEEEADEEEDEEEPPARSRRSRRKSEPEPEPEEDEEDESEEDSEEDDEEESVDLDELAEELDGLTLVKLKARARELGVTPKRNEEKDALIDRILDKVEADQAEGDDEGEDEEEDEEPEPPKATRGRRASASGRTSAAKSSGRGKRGYSDDPPF